MKLQQKVHTAMKKAAQKKAPVSQKPAACLQDQEPSQVDVLKSNIAFCKQNIEDLSDQYARLHRDLSLLQAELRHIEAKRDYFCSCLEETDSKLDRLVRAS